MAKCDECARLTRKFNAALAERDAARADLAIAVASRLITGERAMGLQEPKLNPDLNRTIRFNPRGIPHE